MISVFLNLIRFVLCSFGENVPSVLEKNMCFATVRWGVPLSSGGLPCCSKPLSAYWPSDWGLCPLLEKERWCLPLSLQGSCCALQFPRSLSIFGSSEISVATPNLFWLQLMWNLIVSPFTFSSFLSWHLKWVPYTHLVGSYFVFVLSFFVFIHFATLCLWGVQATYIESKDWQERIYFCHFAIFSLHVLQFSSSFPTLLHSFAFSWFFRVTTCCSLLASLAVYFINTFFVVTVGIM